MDKLPLNVIGIYVEQLEQGGMRIPFSTFFVAVIKHFRVHVSQLLSMGVNRVIMFEIHYRSLDINTIVPLFWVLYNLKGWKKKFFLIDQRAVPDAMSWMHIDTDVYDDFPMNYNEGDADRLAEHIVLLRRHFDICYMCGLTMDCRHPELAQLPVWNGTKVSKVDPIPDTNRPLNIEKHIVDLSEHTRDPTPPVNMAQHEEHVEYDDAQEQLVLSYAHSFHSMHNEDADQHRFVPEWGLREDLRICSYRAYKELISLLATPAEDQVLSSLTNREVIRRTYQSLGRSILSQAELLKRHDQLNSDYTGLCNRSEVQLAELDCLWSDYQREMQKNEWLSKNLTLLDNTHAIKKLEEAIEPKSKQLSDTEGRILMLENEKTVLVAELAQAEMDCQKVVPEFVPTVVNRLHSSFEYQKSLVVPIGLCFTAGWMGKVADSYHLPLDALMKISPNVPPLAADDGVGPSVENNGDGSAKLSFPKVHVIGTTVDAPLKTAT
ncbi:hypothetical protein Tco_1023729 [Tanacetum coccineum]